jgi:gluconolactonase
MNTNSNVTPRRWLASLLALASFSCATSAIAERASAHIERMDPALDAVIAPGTEIERVATGFKFTEGPMWRQGRLWFSDLRADKVFAVTPDGKVEMLLDHAGGLQPFPPDSYLGSNAMATDKDGSVLLIQQGGRKIVRLDAQLRPTLFLDRYQGKRLNSPNDLVFAPDGSLWFTDPPFGLKGMNEDPAKEVPFNGVYRFANGRVQALVRDLNRPNGLAFSPDFTILYVNNSDAAKNLVMRYDVAADGTLANGRVFADLTGKGDGLADGLKVDARGNVYTTGPAGVWVFSPAGTHLGTIRPPEVPANCGWGDDGKTLYMTAVTSVYRVKTQVGR